MAAAAAPLLARATMWSWVDAAGRQGRRTCGSPLALAGCGRRRPSRTSQGGSPASPNRFAPLQGVDEEMTSLRPLAPAVTKKTSPRKSGPAEKTYAQIARREGVATTTTELQYASQRREVEEKPFTKTAAGLHASPRGEVEEKPFTKTAAGLHASTRGEVEEELSPKTGAHARQRASPRGEVEEELSPKTGAHARQRASPRGEVVEELSPKTGAHDRLRARPRGEMEEELSPKTVASPRGGMEARCTAHAPPVLRAPCQGDATASPVPASSAGARPSRGASPAAGPGHASAADVASAGGGAGAGRGHGAGAGAGGGHGAGAGAGRGHAPGAGGGRGRGRGADGGGEEGGGGAGGGGGYAQIMGFYPRHLPQLPCCICGQHTLIFIRCCLDNMVCPLHTSQCHCVVRDWHILPLPALDRVNVGSLLIWLHYPMPEFPLMLIGAHRVGNDLYYHYASVHDVVQNVANLAVTIHSYHIHGCGRISSFKESPPQMIPRTVYFP